MHKSEVFRELHKCSWTDFKYILFAALMELSVFWKAEFAHSLNTDQKKVAQQVLENVTPFNLPTLSK